MKKNDFIELMRHAQAPLKGMIEMIPNDKMDWAPAPGFMNVGQVLKHLSENWCFLKMMVTGNFPSQSEAEMAEAMKLENMPTCTKAEAIAAMEKDIDDTIKFFQEISEEDFFSKVISAPWGFNGEIWKAVLMIKEHSTNHKMQLHLYLKLLGLPVHTGTLYGM